ncbi:MAG: right-handed parallel beta-helix repeat-containing protein [Pedobacter sp.]|nr:right-handed parallel beta-helix repeat-containing protein [Chitinophagaceae bacterium]
MYLPQILKKRQNLYQLFVILIGFLSSLPIQISAQENANMEWVKKVGASSVPTQKKIFKVNDFGAVNDGVTINTNAIQKTIDVCSKNGGGIVTFAAGVYVTGSLFIKENVQFQIDKGVEILGSQNFDDYPEIDTRIAGIEMKWPAALFNVINQKNVSIVGDGRVNARGKFCWDKYRKMRTDYDAKGLRWIVDYDAKRVRTLLVQSSSNVTIKNITFANAGFWTVQLLYSNHITVDGIVVRNNEDGKGPSTDGIDVDSSTWVLIQNCDIDCNDDDFCLKAGRDWDGLRVNKPTEYVVIKNCIARKGGGLLTLGSETSGGIRHVLATNLIGKGTGNGLHIKSATTRGGLIEDIHFTDIQLDSVATAFQFTMNWNPTYSYSTLPKGYNYDSIPAHWKTMLHKVEPAEKGIPQFKDVFVSNITAVGVKKVINAVGLKESVLQNFQFFNVNIKGNVAGDISFANAWLFNNVTIQAANSLPLNVANSTNMKLNK